MEVALMTFRVDFQSLTDQMVKDLEYGINKRIVNL